MALPKPGARPAAVGGCGAQLVVAEVATAVLLLFGAGLLLRTLLSVEGVDRGYRARSVLTMIVDPIGSRYPTPASMLQFYDAVEREVRAIPGVESVAFASTLPLGASYFGPDVVLDRGRSAGGGREAPERRLPDREPFVLRDGGPAGRRRPALRRPRPGSTACPSAW